VSFLRKRRGVSGIISGLFLVAVAVMIFNVLAWQFFQYDAYHRILLERDQREWERFNERLTIANVQGGVNTLRFDVINYGSVSAQITDLYLTNLSATPYSQSRHSLNIWIAPGTAKTIDTGATIEVGDTYRFIITTARGNAFAPIQSTVNETLPGGSQPAPFIFGFGYDDLQYYKDGQWRPAWKIPGGGKYRMRIFLNNTYAKDVRIQAAYSRMTFHLDDFQSGNRRYCALDGDQVVSARTGQYVYFQEHDSNLFNEKRYYLFIELFYNFVGETETYGAAVAILSILTYP